MFKFEFRLSVFADLSIAVSGFQGSLRCDFTLRGARRGGITIRTYDSFVKKILYLLNSSTISTQFVVFSELVRILGTKFSLSSSSDSLFFNYI